MNIETHHLKNTGTRAGRRETTPRRMRQLTQGHERHSTGTLPDRKHTRQQKEMPGHAVRQERVGHVRKQKETPGHAVRQERLGHARQGTWRLARHSTGTQPDRKHARQQKETPGHAARQERLEHVRHGTLGQEHEAAVRAAVVLRDARQLAGMPSSLLLRPPSSRVSVA